MSELSFEPKYFVKMKNGEWALKNNTPSYLLAEAMTEGTRITDDGGNVSRFTEGHPVAEVPLNRGAVDAFR